MIANRKEFFSGLGMMVVFAVVLVLIFSPLYGGKNGLQYLDNLFNSISKGSANYQDMVQEKAKAMEGFAFEVTMEPVNAEMDEAIASVLRSAGATVTQVDGGLKVAGDLGGVLGAATQDSKDMYLNQGQAVAQRRNMEERLALYTWYKVLTKLEKQLTRQELFDKAAEVSKINKRGLETAYNYYGIEAQKASDKMLIIVACLVFYVVYTLWYGFSILFMFEGWGLKLEH